MEWAFLLTRRKVWTSQGLCRREFVRDSGRSVKPLLTDTLRIASKLTPTK